jgi:hypothetical protein
MAVAVAPAEPAVNGSRTPASSAAARGIRMLELYVLVEFVDARRAIKIRL